jgi:predicted acylesterase/phospholipase RssA
MEKLEVSDYTASAQELIEFLKSKEVFDQKEFHFTKELHDGNSKGSQNNDPDILGHLHISDVRDRFGRQCVDLVQEGGGVHGIALAGYTYVLEKMGVSFTKLAGTSAGAINTMLLNCSLTDFELQEIKRYTEAHEIHTPNYQEDKIATVYYGTRSEKILEILSKKEISTIIDGRPSWQKILLNLFKGRVDFHQLKKIVKDYKRSALISISSLFLLIICTLYFLIPHDPASTATKIFKGLTIISTLSLLITLVLIGWGIWKARKLWAQAYHLGINPGKEFEQWIERLLKENGIFTVHSLREKLDLETKILSPFYFSPELNKDPAYNEKEKTNDEFEIIVVKDTDGDEEYFNGELNSLEKLIERTYKLPEHKIKRIVDRIWDRLIRLASNIPTGSPEGELVAKRRIQPLKVLFERAILLLDRSCGYTPDASGEYQLGPYNREVTVVTTDITNEIKVEFPAMHKMYWGDDLQVSPASYVRASMAIPFFFTPFEVVHDPAQLQAREIEWLKFMKIIKRKDPHSTGVKDSTLFVDGGALSNFPINIYATPEMPMPRKPTIGIKLEYEDESIANVVNTEVREIGSIVSTMRYFYDRDFLAKNDMYKRTVRSIDTGQIHWLNFALTETDKLELFFRGALAAALFLIHTHPKIEENRGYWINKVKNFGTKIRCGKKIDDNDTISIYRDGNNNLRHEDLENKDIHFNWEEYKKERLLALSRIKYQRNELKKFPE